MATLTPLKVVIRHLSGSKANQVEVVDVTDRSNLKIGRDNACDIIYDQVRDDLVSRTHAVIKIASQDPLKFTIEDLGSSNGTFLNQRRLEGAGELLPDDKISLGANGPSFVFDVQPRPDNLLARTRVFDAAVSPTRIVETNKEPSATSRDVPAKVEQGAEKVGVGRETLLHEISRERNSNNRKWFVAIGGLLLAGSIGGFVLHLTQKNSEQTQEASIKRVKEEARSDTEKAVEDARRSADEQAQSVKQSIGLSPSQIAKEFGPATAKISASWRLFDQTTGRPIFQKLVELKKKLFPLYVRLPGGAVVPWLTLDDENRSNLPIGGQIEGSGFVVSENGFLLTNKHLAAAWRTPFSACNACASEPAVLIEQTDDPKNPLKIDVIDIASDRYRDLKDWSPEQGGVIFAIKTPRIIGPGNIPDPRKNEQHNFVGRNESLSVTFPGNRLPMNATLIRSSNDGDVALIKVETSQPLKKVELSDGELPSSGERVTVLGFPSVAVSTISMSETIERGRVRTNVELLPQPYISEGIVALVSDGIKNDKGTTVIGAAGSIIQLTINSTGEGNSGGPVFGQSGKVVGLFTYIYGDRVTRNSAATPIKYGIELLRMQ